MKKTNRNVRSRKMNIVGAVLALALAMAVMLSGCGGSNQAPATTTVASAREAYAPTTAAPALGGNASDLAAGQYNVNPQEWADEWGLGEELFVPDMNAVGEPQTNLPEAKYKSDTVERQGYEFDDRNRYPMEDNESYLEIVENREVPVSSQSMFTFSLKVDTASYDNVQRYIENGVRPPADAVKIEELVNYFSYENEPAFSAYDPFAISTEIGASPFDANKYLAFVRVKARDIDRGQLPPCNFTFLIDTSGSMQPYDRLPLLKTSFGMLVETLTKDDVVSIVTYAGSSRVVLDSVNGSNKRRILEAIENLEAGGSTAGAEGINTAYKLAERNFMPNGNNRIILATDGDFNVGVSSMTGLESLVSEKRGNGIYLSILGVGMGNYKDDTMETLAKHGNGNASYINSVASARKVLVDELASNLYVIADDVKAQIELNPHNVKNYRLIGYENRALENKDFSDDTKDAGEVGVGSDVVLLFEFEPYDSVGTVSSEYKYNQPGQNSPVSHIGGLNGADDLGSAGTGIGNLLGSNAQVFDDGIVNFLSAGTEHGLGIDSGDSEYPDELFEVRLRYKRPGEGESRLMLHPVSKEQLNSRQNSDDFRFASAVAAFGHLLRGSSYLGRVKIDGVISEARNSLGRDEQGYRHEFLRLLNEYKNMR